MKTRCNVFGRLFLSSALKQLLRPPNSPSEDGAQSEGSVPPLPPAAGGAPRRGATALPPRHLSAPPGPARSPLGAGEGPTEKPRSAPHRSRPPLSSPGPASSTVAALLWKQRSKEAALMLELRQATAQPSLAQPSQTQT